MNEAATEIAHEYLAEIAPYVGDLELEGLFHRLPGHILTRSEVEEIFNDHSAEVSEGEKVLHALYRVGCSATSSTIWCARRVAAALPSPR